MIKHIGKHGDRKVAILYRTVPGEDHMALVVYSDVIPRMLHDELMGVLESAPGQQAEQLADALFRHVMADGQIALNSLHKEGYIKKVPANQIVVTPNGNSHVRLDELNDILKGMKQGAEATQKMADIDNNKGMRDVGKNPAPQTYSRVIEAAEPTTETVAPAVNTVAATSAPTAQEVSVSLLKKADEMKVHAQAMLEGALRLEAEAKALTPTSNARKKARTKQAS